MKRREALSTISLAAGAAVLLPAGLFSSCQEEDYKGKFFIQSTIELINEIGETILPETSDSPGAKAAKAGNFLDSYVSVCLAPTQQELLKNGLTTFSESCKEKMGKTFIRLSPNERHQYLVQLDESSKKENNTDQKYFPQLKSLILFAYFTSQEGAEKALRYLPIPGRFEGNHSFSKGDKAWAL